jgi:hypothetical protein
MQQLTRLTSKYCMYMVDTRYISSSVDARMAYLSWYYTVALVVDAALRCEDILIQKFIESSYLINEAAEGHDPTLVLKIILLKI